MKNFTKIQFVLIACILFLTSSCAPFMHPRDHRQNHHSSQPGYNDGRHGPTPAYIIQQTSSTPGNVKTNSEIQ